MQYLTNPNEKQLDRLMQIQRQAFITGIDMRHRFRDTLGREHFRVVAQGGDVSGGLAIYPTGQYFGGRRVSMAGIAAVAVAPEARGKGVGGHMMAEVVHESAAAGFAISTLYPAVYGLYQRAGYDLAGHRVEYGIQLRPWRTTPSILPMLALQREDRPLIESVYHRAAGRNNGWLDRHEVLWGRILDPKADQLYIVGFGKREALEGCLLYFQERRPDGALLDIQDWICLTPEAWRRSIQYLAGCSAQLDRMSWIGGLNDLPSRLLPEPGRKVLRAMPWYLRILNIEQAIRERGWPRGQNASVDIELEDDLLEANSGPWRLIVEDGNGRAEAGGTAATRLHVRALASLYSGALSAEELAMEGRITGDAATLSALTRLFAGPDPWMPDFY